MRSGAKFITVEGVDGAGKSTVIAEMKKFLQQCGLQVLLSREPGGTPIAEEIRHLLLSDTLTGISGESEVLMMFAARFEHLRRVIIPALEKNIWVLCDRFTDSTFAYQVYGRGVSKDFVEQLSNLVHRHYQPDLTLLLDIDITLSKARLSAKATPQNRLDSDLNHFQQKVREGYLTLQKEQADRMKRIDANQTIDKVCLDARKQLLKSFNIAKKS